MFGKKCARCGSKIGKDFDFCPYCGNNLKGERGYEKDEDYGFLGRNDAPDLGFPKINIRMPSGFNGLFNSLLGEIDRQMKNIDGQIGQRAGEGVKKSRPENRTQKPAGFGPFAQSGGISISISTASGKNPEIKVKSFGNMPKFREMERELVQTPSRKEHLPAGIKISEEKAKEIAKMPRQEAETRVRRLSNKIVYEIDLPGVGSLKDIVINKLENSIEIKAFSKDRVLFKLLPANLPIIKHSLKDEKLILELRAEG